MAEQRRDGRFIAAKADDIQPVPESEGAEPPDAKGGPSDGEVLLWPHAISDTKAKKAKQEADAARKFLMLTVTTVATPPLIVEQVCSVLLALNGDYLQAIMVASPGAGIFLLFRHIINYYFPLPPKPKTSSTSNRKGASKPRAKPRAKPRVKPRAKLGARSRPSKPAPAKLLTSSMRRQTSLRV